VAALLSVVYALWELTARRGIFADFQAGRAVTLGQARTSDRLDTVLAVVAGVAAVAALVWWVSDRVHRKSGTRAEACAFVVTVVGAVTIAVGMLLASAVTNAGTQAAQGGRGITAANVLGIGFVVLAAGLLLAAVSVRRAPARNVSQPVAQSFPQPQRPW
jgi:heme/copper-type cytochrome/quinol oxidase subunit 1